MLEKFDSVTHILFLTGKYFIPSDKNSLLTRPLTTLRIKLKLLRHFIQRSNRIIPILIFPTHPINGDARNLRISSISSRLGFIENLSSSLTVR